MAISRRGFLGQLAVVAAGLVGLQLDERRPSHAFTGVDLASGPDRSAVAVFRGPGVVDMLDESAWMTVRINGRPVRLLRSRKVPPGFLVRYDDGRAVASSGMTFQEIERRFSLHRSDS